MRCDPLAADGPRFHSFAAAARRTASTSATNLTTAMPIRITLEDMHAPGFNPIIRDSEIVGQDLSGPATDLKTVVYPDPLPPVP
jgi:hypothetical protein